MSVSLNSYEALKQFDAGMSAMRVTPAAMREAGVHTVRQVAIPKARGGEVALPYHVKTEQNASASGEVQAEPDENGLRRIQAAQKKPMYNANRALQLAMQRLATQRPVGQVRLGEQGNQREAAREWIRKSRFLGKSRMNSGFAVLNKVDKRVWEQIDQDGELRLGLAQYKPKDPHMLRFNADEFLKRRPTPIVNRSVQLPVNNMKATYARSYSLLNNMPKPGYSNVVKSLLNLSPEGIVLNTAEALVKSAMRPESAPSRPSAVAMAASRMRPQRRGLSPAPA